MGKMLQLPLLGLVIREIRVLQDPQGQLAPPVRPDLLVPQGHRVLLVQTGQTGQMEAQDLPDLKVAQALLDLQVHPEPPQALEHLPLVRGQ